MPDLPVYFSPCNYPMAAGMDAFLQKWDRLQAYAFPTFSLIRQVLNKLRSCKGTSIADCPLLVSKGMVFRPEPLSGPSCCHFMQNRSSQTASLPSSAPEPPRASSSCMETIQRFARHVELSRGVACPLSLCRRSSSCRLYQHRWDCYRHLCLIPGVRVARSWSRIWLCLSIFPSLKG